jgi:hypothetical protein
VLAVDFNRANVYLELIDNSVLQNYTVTYEAFTPNSISGIVGTNIIQNPMWTINKSDASPTARMNLTFRFPSNPFTDLDGTKYRLYWRPMYEEGDWVLIKNYARAINSGAITFSNIYETGQFMVVQASEQLISDVRGEMYSFSEPNDYIELPNSINVPGDWTAELWFKPESIANFRNILHTDFPNTDNGFRIEMSNSFLNGQLYISISDNNQFRPHTLIDLSGALPGPVGGIFTAGEWYHVAVVGDVTNDRVRAYINGMLVVDEVHSNWPATWPNTVLGRGFNNDADRDFDGSLDEVRFWTEARTQNDIRENMHLTLKGTEPNLLTYYQFNDDLAVGTANGVLDAMGNNNATTINMPNNSYIPSEVAVAGGVSERMTVTSTGVMNFGIPKVAIDFNSNPDGEIVVSRLMTEKPHGWQSIPGDVDNEYFVVWNYGTNQLPVIDEMIYNELSYFTPSITASDVGLYKRGSRQFGPTWGSAIAPASSITTGTPGSATFTGTPLTVGFSQFVIAQTSPVGSLPIELLSFEAERADRQTVDLRWETAVEINNQGFEIERLLEGQTDFVTVGHIAGKGNAVANNNAYYHIDPNSFTGMSYYRLKQIDNDGSSSYSPIRAVAGLTAPSGEGMTVFPNPSNGALNVQILDPIAPQQVYISLLDAQGRLIREQYIAVDNDRIIHLPNLLNGLPNNLYFLQVQTEDGLQQWSQKVSVRP